MFQGSRQLSPSIISGSTVYFKTLYRDHHVPCRFFTIFCFPSLGGQTQIFTSGLIYFIIETKITTETLNDKKTLYVYYFKGKKIFRDTL